MSRATTMGVRGVVMDAEGRVLLIRHTYTPGWHMPGGGIERGETAQEALLRELMEEAGVEADPSALQLISVHANHAFFPNDHVLVFRVESWRQQTPTQKGEIAEISFFSPLDPPQGISSGTNNRLRELFGGQPASALW